MHEDLDRPSGRQEQEAEPCDCQCKSTREGGELETPESLQSSLDLAVWFDING
jgi:hypothetical protein